MIAALLFGGVALLAFVLAEAWRRFALRRGVIDVPGGRSSHAVATPRGAGVGLALALLAGMGLALPAGPARDAVMLSIAAAAAVGLLDDLRPLAPLLKLAGQGLAAVPVAVVLAPVGLAPFDGAFAEAVAVLGAGALAVLLVNAWNFMDGINGIATLAAVAVAAAVVVAGGPATALAGLVAAACLGFLPLNFPRARAFMGDSGSHALGMAMASLLLVSAPHPASIVAAAAASPFLVDVLGTLARRARDGERLTQAHRRHLYQLAVRSGYSHARVALAYAAWMAASGAGVVLFQGAGAAPAVAAGIVLLNAAAWWMAARRFEKRLREEGRG